MLRDLGGGGGNGCTEFCTFGCSLKAAVLAVIGFRGPLFRVQQILFSLKIADRFFLVNSAGTVKMH